MQLNDPSTYRLPDPPECGPSSAPLSDDLDSSNNSRNNNKIDHGQDQIHRSHDGPHILREPENFSTCAKEGAAPITATNANANANATTTNQVRALAKEWDEDDRRAKRLAKASASSPPRQQPQPKLQPAVSGVQHSHGERHPESTVPGWQNSSFYRDIYDSPITRSRQPQERQPQTRSPLKVQPNYPTPRVITSVTSGRRRSRQLQVIDVDSNSSSNAESSLSSPAATAERLVEARLVDEEDPAENLAVGTELTQKDDSKPFQHWTLVIMSLVCLVVVLIVVIVVLAIPRGGDKENVATNETQNDNTVTISPTITNPTPAPTYYDVNLPSFTLEAMEDSYSPPSRAYQWLMADPLLEEYPEARKLQRMALATFYYATKGENWTANDSWLSYEVDECDWYSKFNVASSDDAYVGPLHSPSIGQIEWKDVCNKEGTYTELVLPGNQLAGTLPRELALLSVLERFDVGGNTLEGTLPVELSLMTALRELALHTNYFIGSLPSELGLLANLEILNSYVSPFTGTLPTELGTLSALREIELSGAKISGTIPRETKLLRNLTYFAVQKNMLTGTLMSELGLLTHLKQLYTNSQTISGSIPTELGLLTKLTYLGVHRNDMTGTLPTELGKLTALEELWLQDNLFSGTLPTEYIQMKDLRVPALGGMLLTGTIPLDLWTLPNLIGHDFSRNPGLQGSIPTEIRLAPKSIFYLFFDSTDSWTGSIPSEVGLLTNLDWLSVNDANLVGTIPTELAQLTKMFYLRVDGNAISGSFPSDIAARANLEMLLLNDTMLTGTLPDLVCSIQVLEFDCPDICGCDCPCLAGNTSKPSNSSSETSD